MTKSIRSKLASLLGVALVASALAVAAFPGTAAADDVSGTASALPGIFLNGDNLLGTAACSGSGTPAGASDTCDVQPILDLEPLVDVGVLAQDVEADTNGHVASCAGLVGEGGTLEIGDDSTCAPGGDDDNLGLEVLSILPTIPGLPEPPPILALNAAYASCRASATGTDGAAAVVQGLTVLGNPVGDIIGPDPFDLTIPGVASIKANTREVIPNGIKVTALTVDVLPLIPGGPPLLSIRVGEVTCQVDEVNNDRTSGAFDTAGDVTGTPNQTVQNGTRNALAVTFSPGGDRLDATGVIRLGPGVTIDAGRDTVGGNFEADHLPAGCNAVQNVVDPPDPRIECDLGDLTGGINPTRTIPVVLAPTVPAGGRYEATAQLFATTSNPDSDVATGPGPVSNGGRGPVFGLGAIVGAIPAERVGLIQVAPAVEQNSFTVQDGTTLTITDLDDDLDLPETVPGKLYLDVPDFVEAARFHGVACDTVTEPPATSEVVPSAYPWLADDGNTRFDCGAVPQGNVDRTVALDIAAGTPEVDDAVGRAVVIRRTTPATFAPPAVQENSFYSNLLIDVTNDVVDTTPEVFVDTTVAPASRPAPGGNFTYTVDVENTSTTTEEITAISKRIGVNGGPLGAAAAFAGDADCQVGTELSPAEVCTFTFVDALNGVDGDTETHDVTVIVEEAVGGETDTDNDPATARIGRQSGLEVTKVAADDDLPEPGGDFDYTVTITNPNSIEVTIDTITDSVESGAAFVPDNADDCIGVTLQPADANDDDDSCTFTFTREFLGDAGDSEEDTVVVTGTDEDGFDTADGAGTEEVFIVDDVIGLVTEISADPTTLPEPGGEAEFTVEVSNTLPADADGDNDITLSELFVQYNPTVDAADMDNSTCDTGGVVEPGDTYTCTFTDDITGNAGDVFTYTAWAEGETDDSSYESAKDSATVTLTNVVPELDARVVPDPTSRKTPGGDFRWTLTVTNISPASSDPVTIQALKSELVALLGKDANCDDLIGATLDVGESASCTYTTKVEGPDGKVATELVIVKGVDDENTAASDDAVASVSLTATDAPGGTTTTTTVRSNLVRTGSNSRTTAAAAMLFAGLGLVLTGGGMQQAPELAVEGKRRRRR